MAGGAASLAERREVIAACREATRDLHRVGYQCPSNELGDLVGDLAELAAFILAQVAAVVADAEARGVVAASQYANTAPWVAEYGWHLRREAYTIAKAARLLARPELGEVADSVLTADVDLGTAVVVGAEYDKLAPDLTDEAKPAVLAQLLDMGARCGPSGVRTLTQEILARWGQDGEFDNQQERCRRQVELSGGRETSPGVHEYRLTTDNEGRAVLEAAIGPLSAPRVDKDGNGRPVGEPDTRPAGRRRGEALIEALRRSVTVTHPDTATPTANPKAILLITLDFETLAARYGAAHVVGTRADGMLLGCDTIRKLACDAAIIPAVLGAGGAVLDQGREKRLFTTDQIRALWLRDRQCTFPGCDAPAAWCDAHHLVHWIDGGPTNLTNAALLCGRHHTIAHRDRLAGTLTDHGVQWDRRPGTYQPPNPPPAWPGRSTPGSDHPSPLRPKGRTDPGRPHKPDPANKTSTVNRGMNPNLRT